MDKAVLVADPINEITESIKLIKNSKGYTYELRVRCKNDEEIDKKFLDRLEALNKDMIKRFDNFSSTNDNRFKESD